MQRRIKSLWETSQVPYKLLAGLPVAVPSAVVLVAPGEFVLSIGILIPARVPVEVVLEVLAFPLPLVLRMGAG